VSAAGPARPIGGVLAIELGRLGRAVALRWWLVVACVAAGGLAAVLVASAGSDEYQAQTTLTVQAASPAELPSTRDRMVRLATANETLREASERYGGPVGVEWVRNRVTVRAPGQVPLIEFTARGPTPKAATNLAYAIRDATLGRALAAARPDGAPEPLVPASEPQASDEPLGAGLATALLAGALLGLVAGLAGAVVGAGRAR
jgi:hypothetical protein